MSWQTVQLSDVAVLDRRSIHPKDADPTTYYVGLEHIDGDGTINGEQRVSDAKLKSNKFLFSGRHILFGKLRPYLRKIARPSTSGVCSTDIIPILPKDLLSREYLFHLLRTPAMVELATSRSSGANLPRLSPNQLAAFPIPLPPLSEQKRIGGILDAADLLRAKRREALDQLDMLLQNTFLDMFGDPVTNPMEWKEEFFGDLVEHTFRNGLSPSSKGKVKGEVLTLSAITSGSFDFSERKGAFFDREPAPDQRLRTGTFLICRGNGNKTLVGVASFPDRDELAVCFPDTMIGVTVNSAKLEPAYLRSIWRSRRVRRQIESGARTTNGTHKVNQKLLASITFPVPPLPLQRRFAAIVESIERQEVRMRAHLAELDALFASLQSRAFNGEL